MSDLQIARTKQRELRNESCEDHITFFISAAAWAQHKRAQGGENNAGRHTDVQDAAFAASRADDGLHEKYVGVSAGHEFQIFMNMDEYEKRRLP
jgi:hypothetical protein